MQVLINKVDLEFIKTGYRFDDEELEDKVLADVTFLSSNAEVHRTDFKILFALVSVAFSFAHMCKGQDEKFNLFEDYDFPFGSMQKLDGNVRLSTPYGDCECRPSDFLNSLESVVDKVKCFFTNDNDMFFAWLAFKKGFFDKNGLDIEALPRPENWANKRGCADTKRIP